MNSSMLGLEMPIHQQQQKQNHPNSHHFLHSQILPNSSSHLNFDDHHLQSQQPANNPYSYPSPVKPKPQSPLSDEDEPNFNVGDSTIDGKRKAAAMSPWQRMKWTDDMVKLLIMAVFYIGDEAGTEPIDPTGKKRPVGGLSQKKGKWKSVSRAMMEKGSFVSPQQCEDKFNDLNKRYKRVTDILGKGTACKVVENQSLLESMELSPKLKEEVKKLLNSKQLFFREMCAYHNSCGHIASNPSVAPVNEWPNSARRVPVDERNEEEEQEFDSEEDNDSEDVDDDDDHGLIPARKRLKTTAAGVMQQLSNEVVSVIEDGRKSEGEKKHWMKMRLMELEEQVVRFEYKALELEKQRLKWLKFSSKKEREMERSKLENERRRLENERMVLLIRQREIELIDH